MAARGMFGPLREWASVYRDGISGKEAIILRDSLAKPSGATTDDFVGRVLWAFKNVSRAELDAVFAARVAANEDARQALLQIEALRVSGEPVPSELRQRAALAGRSSRRSCWAEQIQSPRPTFLQVGSC